MIRKKEHSTDMADKFTVEHLDLYYGDFHALKNINMILPEHEVRLYRPQRMRKIDIFKDTEPNE